MKTRAINGPVDLTASYDMIGIHVDGNGPVAMSKAARDAVNRARVGHSPTLLEAMTFRFRGHLVRDSSDYIPKAQMELAQKNHPMPKYRRWLLTNGHANTPMLEMIEAPISSEIDEAVEFAMGSPYSDLIENRRDAYSHSVPI